MLGGGKHNTDSERTHKGQLLLSGGARNGFTEEPMGTTAFKEFHQERRSWNRIAINTSVRCTAQAGL